MSCLHFETCNGEGEQPGKGVVDAAGDRGVLGLAVTCGDGVGLWFAACAGGACCGFRWVEEGDRTKRNGGIGF